MGGALVRGWHKAGQVEITATAHTQATLYRLSHDCPEISVTTNNVEAVKDADIVVLAVKPWLIDSILEEIMPSLRKEQLVISVAANAKHPRIDVYAMPNIAAEFGESMTFVAAAEGVPASQTALIEALFSLVGSVKVCEERLIAPGMMMAGCGIAYVMRFLRAMMEGGVEMGFYPKDAQLIAQQTMQGAITLLSETGLHPEAAIDKVTTPGGVTIKGLNELDHAGFNSAVIRCLKAGLKK